jgi:signal transduction histidine kinase
VVLHRNPDSVTQGRVFPLVLGVLSAVFLLSVLWEFVLEEPVLKYAGFEDASETFEERWQYVISIVSFTALSLGIFALFYRRFHDGNTIRREAKGEEGSLLAPKYFHITLPIGFFGVAMVALILFLSNTGSKMTEQIGSMIDASMEIKAEVGFYHLWFEELDRGNPAVSNEKVWEHFDNAKWYANAMIEGGQRGELTFIPLDDPEIVSQVNEISRHLDELGEVGRKREQQLGAIGFESVIDQDFHQHFNEVIGLSLVLEEELHRTAERSLRNYMTLSYALAGSVLAFTFGVGYLLHRYERRREDYESFLRLAREEAEDASNAKSDFLASMSHDLRTPLNAIMGFSEMMKEQTLGPLGAPRYKEYAQDIHKSGNILISLINGILDLSKIEAGKYELSEMPLDVAKLIQDSVGLIMQQAEAKKANLKIAVEQNLPALYADTRAINQILTNLLSNAVKFTLEGGQITISAQVEDDGGLLVQVMDTGIGMSEQDIAKALEPFGQVGDHMHSRKHAGTGLGLYICSNLMGLHGGSLGIESTIGEGTVVSAYFPPKRVASAKQTK